MSSGAPQDGVQNGEVQVANQGVAGQGEQQQQQGSRFWSLLKGLVFRAVIIYFITSYFRRSTTPPQTGSSDPSSSIKSPSSSSNLFSNGTLMDMYVYICEDEFEPDFRDSKQLVWLQKELIYGDWYSGPDGDGTYVKNVRIETPKRVQDNGTLFIHIYFVQTDYTPYPSEKHSSIHTIHRQKLLNKYKKRYYKKTHNLISGETAASVEEQMKVQANIKQEILSHWHPNLTINIINDQTPWTKGAIPAPLNEYIDFEPNTGKYYPIVYLNDYWNLMRDYKPINDTVSELTFRLTYQPISLFRWQLYTAQAMRAKWTSFMGSDLMEQDEDEQDIIKETFLETSPVLLALTVIVSITHSVFEFLAFKNDIQFWKNRRSLEGLSVRSVFFNVFQSVIVLLYVLDNDTNFLVRVSVGIGLLIELWKIQKVLNIEISRNERMLFGLLPFKIKFSDKGSYVESSTKQYDLLAFKYLSWALFPLLLGYSVYSLIYNEHKGWYSFILNMVYGFLLTFGFIMMTPQLFINYKLKSVAHLPWRMLTYKFLNTFIDDIFAFVIKMPTMYRLGCFRDDIIFLIFLYQRWIYRVDLSRVNEFGISGDDIAQAALGQQQQQQQQGVQQQITDGSNQEETKKDK